jgi:hypothetical protein
MQQVQEPRDWSVLGFWWSSLAAAQVQSAAIEHRCTSEAVWNIDYCCSYSIWPGGKAEQPTREPEAHGIHATNPFDSRNNSCILSTQSTNLLQSCLVVSACCCAVLQRTGWPGSSAEGPCRAQEQLTAKVKQTHMMRPGLRLPQTH